MLHARERNVARLWSVIAQVDEHHVAGGALDQGADGRGSVLADDEGAAGFLAGGAPF
jgi:hypothetical protein